MPGSDTPRREYRKQHGSWYFYDMGGRMVSMADEIAICYAVTAEGNATILKHGEAAAVRDWFKNRRIEWELLFPNAAIIEARDWASGHDWNEADLNECLRRPHRIIELLEAAKQGEPHA